MAAFQNILVSTGYAPGTIYVNVDACKTSRSIHPSTFNRFPVIQPLIPKMTDFYHILVSLNVNVTWRERGFNACKTPRTINPSILPCFCNVSQTDGRKNGHFQHILVSTRHAPGTSSVNIEGMGKGFDACKTPRSINPSSFNRFLVIQPLIPKMADFYHILVSAKYAPLDNRGKCHMDGYSIQ